MRERFLAVRGRAKDPRTVARAVVGLLLLANVVAALIAFHPWGGGPEELQRRQQDLRRQANDLQARIARSKTLVAKVEQARKEARRLPRPVHHRTPQHLLHASLKS